MTHADNQAFTRKGWEPLFSCSKTAKIVVIGQAPGIRAQEINKVWEDKSGERLIDWLGITYEELRDDRIVSLLPMDFYYPGKNEKGGDLPPRKGFAEQWHTPILAEMPDTKLIVLVGKYAQDHYLSKEVRRKNLTENVYHYRDFLPDFFPIVHPSPLNFRWLGRNPWFEKQVVPALRREVKKHLND